MKLLKFIGSWSYLFLCITFLIIPKISLLEVILFITLTLFVAAELLANPGKFTEEENTNEIHPKV